MLVLGGRAPQFRWGQGSLQEIDHVPFVRPLVKLAATALQTAEIPALLDEAMRCAIAPQSGPVFLDFPLDFVFGEADEPAPAAPLHEPWRGAAADAREIDRVAASLRDAERPVIMAGAGLYWGHGEDALVALAEELRIPVFVNGLARGCMPADHELAFSRARGTGLRGADVALVIGAPLDFRLGYGAAFAQDAEIVAIDVAEPDQDSPRTLGRRAVRRIAGDARRAARRRRRRRARLRARRRGSRRCAPPRTETRAGEAAELSDERAPLHPMRVYGELIQMLDRDAIVVGDGGDFVSYAGRVLDSYHPGCWLDPGPLGCLGCGFGYALAAKLAHPDRQVVLLLGDGAFGFSGMELDTLARHDVAVRRRRRQQRHLGPREVPDGGPLRLLGSRRAQPRHPLRPGSHGPRLRRRAGVHATPSSGRRWSERSTADGRRWSTCSPTQPSHTRAARTSCSRPPTRAREVGADVRPAALAPDADRVSTDDRVRAEPLDVRCAGPEYENRPHSQRAASDPGLAQSGRAGVRARKGRLEWLGRREAPMSAASPEPMLGAKVKPGPGQSFPLIVVRNNRTFVQFCLGPKLDECSSQRRFTALIYLNSSLLYWKS